jgi:hypothetical protein
VQRPHHRRRQVVLVAGASGIPAGHEKQGRCPVHHDATGVPISFDDARAVLDEELEVDECRHLVAKTGGLVLTPASLRKTCSLRAVPARIHHRARSVTIRSALRSWTLGHALARRAGARRPLADEALDGTVESLGAVDEALERIPLGQREVPGAR